MKDKTVAALLAFFLGWAGVHKFYLRQPLSGVLYILFAWTTIPIILSMIDFLVLALMDNDEFNRRYNYALAPAITVNMLPPAYAQNVRPSSPYGPQPPMGHPMQGGHGHHGGPAPTNGVGPYATPPMATQPVSSLDPEELGRKLEKLNELRISGLLTEEEFSAQKARLLNQM